MAKLLPTRLPVATTEISVDLYNRLIRILEINLGEFDPSNTDQFTTTERNNAIFNPGSIIWNTTVNSLQVWTGFGWYNIDAAPEKELHQLVQFLYRLKKVRRYIYKMAITRAQLAKTTKKRNHRGCGKVMKGRRKKTTYA